MSLIGCITDSMWKIEACDIQNTFGVKLFKLFCLSFLSFKMSSRPHRSCRIPVVPVFREILEQVYEAPDTIPTVVQKVTAFYKDDIDKIAAFWFAEPYLFDWSEPIHIKFLGFILAQIPLNQDLVVKYLAPLLIEQLQKLGITRVIRGTKTYYRILTGIHTQE
jgi:hypothetical protein